MRICSLLPSATEMLFALGLGDQVVGVSHSCDYPEEARGLPVLTRPLLPGEEAPEEGIPVHDLSAAKAHTPNFALDGDLLRDIHPDLILTQDLCEVCAIGSNTVFQVASEALGYTPEFLNMDAERIEDILQSLLALGQAAGAEEAAWQLAASLRGRIEAVQAAVVGAERKRVFCLEWAEPLMAAGHWVSESVEVARGAPGMVGPGEWSRIVTWDELAGFAPEVVLFSPCGWDMERNLEELAKMVDRPEWLALPAVRNDQVYVFDGRVSTRHGPRSFDVLEAFAEVLHPQRVPPRWEGILYQREK